jgi:hypothetical protein
MDKHEYAEKVLDSIINGNMDQALSQIEEFEEVYQIDNFWITYINYLEENLGLGDAYNYLKKTIILYNNRDIY